MTQHRAVHRAVVGHRRIASVDKILVRDGYDRTESIGSDVRRKESRPKVTAKIQRVYGDTGRSLAATDLGDKVIRTDWRCPLARKSVAAQRIEGVECASDPQASRRVFALHQPDRVTHDSEGDKVVMILSLPDDLNDRTGRLVESFDRGVDPVIVKGLRLAQDPLVTRLVDIEPEDLSTELGLYDDPGRSDFGIRLFLPGLSRRDGKAPDPEDQRDNPLSR